MKDYNVDITIKVKRRVAADNVHRAVVQAEDSAIEKVRAIYPDAEISAKAVKQTQETK